LLNPVDVDADVDLFHFLFADGRLTYFLFVFY